MRHRVYELRTFLYNVHNPFRPSLVTAPTAKSGESVRGSHVAVLGTHPNFHASQPTQASMVLDTPQHTWKPCAICSLYTMVLGSTRQWLSAPITPMVPPACSSRVAHAEWQLRTASLW